MLNCLLQAVIESINRKKGRAKVTSFNIGAAILMLTVTGAVHWVQQHGGEGGR